MLDKIILKIDDLAERINKIENDLELISDEILKESKGITRMQKQFEQRFDGESKDLKKKIGEIETALKDFDLRIQHFETHYKKK